MIASLLVAPYCKPSALCTLPYDLYNLYSLPFTLYYLLCLLSRGPGNLAAPGNPAAHLKSAAHFNQILQHPRADTSSTSTCWENVQQLHGW